MTPEMSDEELDACTEEDVEMDDGAAREQGNDGRD